MKTNIIDIAVTFFGICYIVIFIMFVSLVRENINNGKILIWFIFITAWGTDIFAYIIGKTLGKHKFTKIDFVCNIVYFLLHFSLKFSKNSLSVVKSFAIL